jgi:hypothetical protein
MPFYVELLDDFISLHKEVVPGIDMLGLGSACCLSERELSETLRPLRQDTLIKY